jgi:dienelactone hydrolase
LVYFPGSNAQTEKNSERIEFERVAFLVRSGRAVLLPVYKGTYERGDGARLPLNTTIHRDGRIQQYQDVARSVDYLESRPDIDKTKIGYFGSSWGGGMGAHFPALEKRFKVSVLALPGFLLEPTRPEADSFNFAPRVTIPTLMLSGKYDFTFPMEQSQKPFFEALGSKEKVHRVFDTGHIWLPSEFARESLAWLDKYLGPAR